jgi:hypothetical protein
VEFARAITGRSVFLAEVALGELENVLLEDALQMVTLDGEQADPKYVPESVSHRLSRASYFPRLRSSSAPWIP